MGRQLFLHHYLPAHLASCLVTGALVEFIFCAEPMDDTVAAAQSGKKPVAGAAASGPKRHVSARERFAGQSMVASWVATAIILAVVAGSWYFFLPLTYGYPGLSVDEIIRRKWLGYDLHFAK